MLEKIIVLSLAFSIAILFLLAENMNGIVGFFSEMRQSYYYFFIEKQIKERLGAGFIFKELGYHQHGFSAIVQRKGIRYEVITEKRKLIKFHVVQES